MSASLVLVVDDDEIFNQVMARSLRRKGYEAITASSVTKAKTLLTRFVPDMAIVDLKIPGTSGLQLIPELKAFNQNMSIVVLTGYASIATAVEAIRQGARDYLCKPASTQEILLALSGQTKPLEQQDIPDTPMSVNRLEWEYIPIAFQDATLLSAFAHPDHLLFVGSRGFALLSPSSILKSNGYIQKVLQENSGNISATARSLGMHRRTLQRKLAKCPSS